ncbi:LysR family transcriptional regulator [Shewanella sp. GXUN23E]|uniref:LysR family transcriptional regulator n=1 Tax=Shewanella sp. GXUN23E TaxID=3422498 RepID=UPI003D7EF3D5
MFNSLTIHAFYYSAKFSSFSKAAEILDTSQPNISSKMIGLERSLGTKLFVRKQGRVDLSPEGEKLYLAAEKIVNGHREFDSIVQHFMSDDPIIIVTQPRLYKKYLADYITREFVSGNRVHIRTGELSSIKNWMEKEEADIVVTEGLFDDYPLYRKYQEIECLNFIWAKSTQLPPSKPMPVIAHSKVWDHWHDLTSVLQHNDDYQVTLVLDTPDFVQCLVEKGIGIALLPETTVLANPLLEPCPGPTQGNVAGPISIYIKKGSHQRKVDPVLRLFS